MRYRLEPIKRVAQMRKTHLDNIRTYVQHRMTNAVTEGLIAKIQWLNVVSWCYHNRDAFGMAIYFHCDGWELEPRCA
jgi:transposase